MRLTLNTLLAPCLVLFLFACTVPAHRAAEVKDASPANQSAIQPTAQPVVPIVIPPVSQPVVQPVITTAERYVTELSNAQGLTTAQIRREVAALNTDKRLDNTQRFRLAALLSRDEHGDWERAIKALDGLGDDPDPRAQALVAILKKSLRARFELRQQTARVIELQERIQQIKALEKNLQQRIEPLKTP